MIASVGGATFGVISHNIPIAVSSMAIFTLGIVGQTRGGWLDKLWHSAGRSNLERVLRESPVSRH